MMIIMEISATPQRHPTPQTPRKVIAGMRIDRLKLTQRHPHQHRDQMHIPSDPTVDQRWDDRAQTQEHGLPRTGVFGGQAEGGGVLVVDAVDAAVQRAPVHGAMEPVVVGVFEEEPEEDVRDHGAAAWEGDVEADAEDLHHGVEEDDHGEFDDEVNQEDVANAVPLVGGRGHFLVLDLVFEKDAGKGVGDGPGDTSAEVDEFVSYEGEYAGGDDGVVPVGIVRPPELLEIGQLGVLLVCVGEKAGVGESSVVGLHDIGDRHHDSDTARSLTIQPRQLRGEHGTF